MNDVTFLSATVMAAAIQSRQISALQLLEAHLQHIKHCNLQLNAIVTLDEERARWRAKEADAALDRGEVWGPLHGVPITVKDAIETLGLRTTAGYKPLANHVPKRDAPVVTSLRTSGAIVLGKTNLPPLAMGAQTNNPIFGRTNNPWSIDCTPGGSSGGSAAAVAAGLSPLDIASDISGSIRMPAHFCGVYGLKPTGGRVPLAGHIASAKPLQLPKSWQTLLLLPCIGPIARSVADLRLCLQIIADPNTPPLQEVPQLPPQELRIAWTDDMGGMPISEDIRQAIRELAAVLSTAGFKVERISAANFDYDDAWELAGEALSAINTLLQLPSTRLLRRIISATLADRLPADPLTRGFLRGAGLQPARMQQLMQRRKVLASSIDQFLDQWHVWICPACASPAFTHCSPRSSIVVDGHKLSQDKAEVMPSVIFNLTGHPAVVIPVDQSRDGLPIGVQIVGRQWGEMALLNVAEQIAKIAGPYRRPPRY